MKFMFLICIMVTLRSETLLYMSTPQYTRGNESGINCVAKRNGTLGRNATVSKQDSFFGQRSGECELGPSALLKSRFDHTMIKNRKVNKMKVKERMKWLDTGWLKKNAILEKKKCAQKMKMTSQRAEIWYMCNNIMVHIFLKKKILKLLYIADIPYSLYLAPPSN